MSKRAKRNKIFFINNKNFIVFFIFALAAALFLSMEMGPRNSTANISGSSSKILAHAPRDASDDHPHDQAEQKLKNISFPIRELGNCASKEACQVFCEKQGNMLACVNFAEKHSLISRADATKGRKMAELGINKGPGGCDSANSCEAYCSNIKNIRECVAFGKKNNMISKDELAEAEKVIAALDKGAKLPGGCTGKASCDAYCQKPENIRSCIDFAEAAGFVNKKEAAMIRQTGGVGPGGCFGKDACEAYCMQAGNMQACIEFATKYDLMPPGEKDEALKVLAALKKGVKLPGGCTGKAACETFCKKPENMKECFAFAEAAGFIPPEEAKFIRKMMEKGITGGPGGCMGKESCESFCKKPQNMLQCLAFMKKAGITQEDLPKNFGPPRDSRSTNEREDFEEFDEFEEEFKEFEDEDFGDHDFDEMEESDEFEELEDFEEEVDLD